MVHSPLSKIGYVLGGAQAVVRALIGILGPGFQSRGVRSSGLE
jgi:hypothetical protein